MTKPAPTVAFLLLAAFLAACSSKTSGTDPGSSGAFPAKDGGGGILGAADGGATAASECADSTKLIYVVSEEGTLYRFQPTTVTFDPVGIVRCSPGASPTSMAVDRHGTAWVRHSDGTVWKVSTRDATCAQTTFDDANVFLKFGMGFSTDGASGSKETLFLSDSNGSGLGAFDTTTLKFRAIGRYNGELAGRAAELTGTGDGRLYGFFTTSPAQIGEIDKATGHIKSATVVANTNAGVAWAFSFYGGDFYVYTASGGSGLPKDQTGSTVTRYRPSDRSTTVLKQGIGFRIVGAGVSTCAPLVQPK